MCTVQANNEQKDTKRPKNPQMATSEDLGAKSWYWKQKQGIALAPGTHYLSHPSFLTPGYTPTHTSYKEPA